ncbi:MAG: DUF1559 domain-containing protein [Planctomycetota bacterium]
MQPKMGFRISMRRRHAWTLIELLVVIAIIGALVSVLLPAVQYARESARQTSCRNHMRQIGLALHQYHGTYRSLPIGCVEWRGWRQDHRKNMAWSAMLLPFLEQRALHDAIDFDYPYDHEVNAVAASTNVSTYLCPTAVNDQSVPGRISYGGLFGERLVDSQSNDGVFLHDRVIRFRDCTDGLSTTLCNGEDVVGPDSQWINGHNVFVQSHPINSKLAWIGDNEIRSQHPAGAMVLFLDGSVHLLNESLDTNVLGQIITRAKREVIDANAF